MELFKETQHSKLIEQFRLEVRTELEAIIEVLKWFEQSTNSLLPEKCRWQCKLALAEAFTNTVLYAHHHLPATTPIVLEVNFFPNFLEIRLYDQGEPFDIQSKLRSLHESNRASLDGEGDRGLLFMEALTDGLQSLRLSGGYNCLVMRKVRA